MKDWQKQIVTRYFESKWLLDSRCKSSPWKIISFPYNRENYSHSVTISSLSANTQKILSQIQTGQNTKCNPNFLKNVNYTLWIYLCLIWSEEKHFQIINCQQVSFILLILYNIHKKCRIEFLSKNRAYKVVKLNSSIHTHTPALHLIINLN